MTEVKVGQVWEKNQWLRVLVCVDSFVSFVEYCTHKNGRMPFLRMVDTDFNEFNRWAKRARLVKDDK